MNNNRKYSKKMHIIKIISLMLILVMLFENSVYVLAYELKEAGNQNKEQQEIREIEEAQEKKQAKLYEKYFERKPTVSLSGNEALFYQDMKTGTKNEDSEDNADRAEEKKTGEQAKTEKTEAERNPILTEGYEKEEPVHVGRFEKTYQTSVTQYKTVFTTYPNTFFENGVEKVIDNTLLKEACTTEKSISQNTIENAEGYTNAEGYIDTVVRGNKEECQLQMSLEDTSLTINTESGDYSKESVSENAIRYNDVYDNVDVQYTITNAGIKEDIILLTKDSRKVFSYTLKKDGITAQKQGDVIHVYKENNKYNEGADGNTVSDNDIDKKSGNIFAIISAPQMEDAVGAVSKGIEMEISENEDEYIITIKPDTKWLNSEERVYPVMIDPTTTLQTEIMDFTVTSGGNFLAGESRHYTGNLGTNGIARYFLITSFLYQSIFQMAGTDRVEILDATLRLVQTNDSTGSVIGCYRNMSQLPPGQPSFDMVAGIDRKIAGENATSPAGRGVHNFDVKDAVSGWMNGIYESHGFVLILDNENKAGVEIAGIGAENIADRPSLTINWQVAGDVFMDYPLDDTTINLRPMVKSDISGALQCYGVFADGIAKPDSVVTYDLNDTSKNYKNSVRITNEKKYPNSSSFDSIFPNGTIKYADRQSNWQTIVPFTDFSYDTLYCMNAKAGYSTKSGKTVNSDNFIIYKVSRYDTMKRIADYYGVGLSQLLFDNKAPDMLLVENNTLFIRNPTKNRNNPYQPADLTDEEKAQIDRALLGRARHCEYGFEPINLSTGNYYLSQEDLSYSDCFGNFNIVRSYNSLNSARRGSFGRGFTSFLDENIAKNTQGDIFYNREDGSTLLFSKQADGSYKAPDGCDVKLSQKKIGERVVNLSSGDAVVPIFRYLVEREDGTVITFDETGVMVEIAEKNGAVMQILYDAISGNVTGIMREGVYFSITTNERGSVTKITCPDSNCITYEYDSEDNLIKVINPAGYEKRFVYDENHLMTAWYDENNTPIVRNTFDAMGRVIKQLDEGGIAHTLSYTPGKTITTDGNGNKTEYSYDAQGRTTQILYADGNKETKTYENGYLASEADTDGNITTYTYDENGKITEKKIGNKIWTYDYDSHGNLIKTVDPLGNVSTGVFNGKDLVTKTTDGDGRNEYFSYDDRGRLVSYTDSDGLKTTYTYQNNRLYQKKIGNSLMAVYAYNAMGNVTEEKDAMGHTLKYTYDTMQRCTARKDKNGIQTTYTFYPNGLLKSVTDGKNHTLSYAYDVYGNIRKIIQPDGGEICYTYDAEKNLLSQTDAMGNTKTFTYDNRNRLKTATDESGYTVIYEYDSKDNVIKKSDEKGSIFEASYDTVWGLPVTETDAMGHKTDYEYDAMGNLLSVTYEDELQFTYEYDALMRRIKETFANGFSYSYTFDARNNLIKKEDGNGLSEETVYNDFCEPVKEITRSGRITSYTYDLSGNLMSKTDPEGNETVYSCDNAGNVIKVTDSNGSSTEYTYDACGNITTLKRADGTVLQYAYDENENLTAYKDGNDNITTYAYDRNGNRILVTDALGQVTTYTYNELNYLTQTTDALNQTTIIAYDYAGNIKKVTDGNGADITFTYDRNRNLLTETDEKGHTKSYLYDVYGRIVKEKDAAGNETFFAYDEVGNHTKTTDALSHETTYDYDLYGNLIKKTDALGNGTSYTYDDEGELIKVTDARGSTASYEYDKNGNLIKETDALGNVRSYSYDAVGNLIEECNALGNITQYSYDSVYHLTQTTQADGSCIRLAYDNEGHVTELWDARGNKTGYEYDALGRIIKITDPKGYETCTAYDALSRVVAEKKGDSLYQYTYDAVGNRLTETDPMENTTSYVYDKAGCLIKKKTPDQREWLYAYDVRDQLIHYTDGDGKVTTYSYDALKRLSEVKNAGITRLKYDYDALSNVTKITDGNGSLTQYEYDAAGNRTAVVNANGIRTTYSYDNAGRLIKKKYANGAEETYAYDGEGNLLKQTSVTGLVTTYAYDAVERLTKETQTADGRSRSHSYEYDENGNLIKETNALQQTTTYQYDENDRLTEVLSPLEHKTAYTYTNLDNIDSITDAVGNIYRYTYDKKGRILTEALDDTLLKNYEYDSMDRIVRVECNDSVVTYRYDATNLSETERNGEKEQYQYNALGELIKKTDSLKNEVSFAYDPAGNLTEKTDENGTTIRYRYDSLNQLLDVDSRETQSSSSYIYDEMGKVICMEDVTGKSNFTYDTAGRLLSYEGGDGKRVEYSYDGFGNLSTMMYPDGSVVSYTYDDEGRLKSMHSDEGMISYDYDAEGNVVKIIRENGTAVLSYDDLNRVKNLVNTCNGKVISAYGYAYDNRSNITKETVLIYAGGKEIKKENSYKYDILGELVECKSREGNEETLVTYAYDLNGNRIKMDTTSKAGNQSVSYRYDHGREVYEEEKTDGVITRVTEKSYDDAGNLIKEVVRETDTEGKETVHTTEDEGNVTERYYSYDAKGRLSAIADKDRLIFAALYDGGDNRVFTLEYDEKIRESGNAGKTDAEKKAGRKKIKEALQDEKEAGRDKSETKDDEISENTELSEIGQENPEAEAPQNAFLYGVLMEAAGFLPVSTPVKQWIKKHVDFYLSCAIVEEDVSDFVYTDVKAVDYESGFTAFDAINAAIREKTGTGLDEEDYQKISYVNDINRTNEEVLYETVAGGNGANGSFSYRYGLQRENYSYEGVTTTSGYPAFDAVKIGQTGTYYYDGYGSVSNLVAGKDSLSYVYDAYGNMQKLGMYKDVSTDSAAYASPYGYNGEYSHALSGLQYLRARYYNAESGSFISKDSYAGNIRSILSANRYTYGENNPLGYADPSGHSVLTKIKSVGKTLIKGAKESAKNTFNYVKTAVSNVKNTVVNTIHQVGNAFQKIDTTKHAGETDSQWKNRVAQEQAKKSGAKADLVAPEGINNLIGITSAVLNPTGVIPARLAILGTSVKTNFENNYSNYLFERTADAMEASAYSDLYYQAAEYIYQAEVATCAAYEYCRNLPQELIKAILPNSAPERIIHGVELIKSGNHKGTGGVALTLAGVLASSTGIGVMGITGGIYETGAGISQMAEGVQEIYYGINGDTEKKAINYYAENFYDGYYEIYDKFGNLTGDLGMMAFTMSVAGGTMEKPWWKKEVINVGESGTYSWKIGSAEDAKYLGKGNVGDFSNLEGATIEEVLSRIPEDAVRRELIPEVGKVTEGFEYKWVQDGKTYRVRIHGADASAPAGSNAANGWVVRVQQGKKYLDPISLEFQPPGITNIASPNYSEELANSTHIPIKNPE